MVRRAEGFYRSSEESVSDNLKYGTPGKRGKRLYRDGRRPLICIRIGSAINIRNSQDRS